MKTFFIVAGAACLALGFLALACALFFRFAYYHTHDGSDGLYERLRKRSKIFLFASAAFAASGAACAVVYFLL